MVYKKERYEKGEFSQYPTRIILDKRLSASARAVLLYFLSNTSEWNYSEQNICQNFGIKITELRSALKQLTQYGYLYRKRVYIEGKFNRYEYHIYENPDDNENYIPF